MQPVASPLEQEAQQERELAYTRRVQGWLRAAERDYAIAEGNNEKRVAKVLEHACLQYLDNGNGQWLRALPLMKRWPVTVDEFVESRDFLGEIVDIWPTLRQDVRDINPDILTGEKKNVRQVLIGGATNTGKTEVSKVSLLYRTYFLTCFAQPQKLFFLNPSTMLVVMFQNVQITQTRRVQYDPFRHNFLAMPYVQKYLRWDKHREASLVLKDINIEITMGLPTVQAMVGSAIVMAHQDEVNFMQVVENSKQVAGANGQGGYFDQAEIAFRNITRRRKGRMTTQGPDPSLICVTSSTRYKDDFLDRRIQEARDGGEEGNGVLIYRRKQYEVQPAERYKGGKCRVLVGNETYGTRLLTDADVPGVDYPEHGQIEIVPDEFADDFRNDPEGSLRDIIGISSNALHPYITQRHKILEAIVRGKARGLRPWVDKQDVNLTTEGMPQFNEANMPSRQERAEHRWYAHIDLSKKKDRCGISICRTDGHVPMLDEKTGVREYLPRFIVPMIVTIKPSQAVELDIGGVRQWLSLLHSYYGFNLVSVTYDGFQSSESIMMWKKGGVMSSEVSADVSSEVHDYFKRALYQDRVDMIESEIARIEYSQLEQNETNGKIDHPPKGSKDAADAISSAVYAGGRDRSVREHTRVTVQVQETREDGTVVVKEVGNAPVRRRVIRRRGASK